MDLSSVDPDDASRKFRKAEKSAYLYLMTTTNHASQNAS